MSVFYKIVGAFHRTKEGCPAQAILNRLPVGTELFLVREPSNEYDPNAIAVNILTEKLFAAVSDQAKAEIIEAFQSCGTSEQLVMESRYWPMGYIPRDTAPPAFHDHISSCPNGEYIVAFTPDMAGKPGVTCY